MQHHGPDLRRLALRAHDDAAIDDDAAADAGSEGDDDEAFEIASGAVVQLAQRGGDAVVASRNREAGPLAQGRRQRARRSSGTLAVPSTITPSPCCAWPGAATPMQPAGRPDSSAIDLASAAIASASASNVAIVA